MVVMDAPVAPEATVEVITDPAAHAARAERKDGKRPLGVLPVRAVIVIVMMSIVATAAGDIFDRRVWWLLTAPVVVGAVTAVLHGRKTLVRLVGTATSIIVATAIVVIVGGGNGATIVDSLIAGPPRLLTTDWPSPDLPELVGTIAFGLGLATAAAVTLAQRSQAHLSPILPVIAAQVAVIALSAKLGTQLHWLISLAVLGIVLAALPAGAGLADRVTLLRGERNLVPVAVIAVAASALLAASVTLVDRADPRRNDPPSLSAPLLDPVEATLALRALDPAIDLHQVVIDGATAPARWRTAALSDYDGTRWAPDLALRPIGRRLNASTPESIGATISFLDDDLQLIPLPGAAVTVDHAVETDSERAIVRLSDRPTVGQTIAVVTEVEPDLATLDTQVIGTREIGENAAGLSELAGALVEQGGASASDVVLDQLRAIESTLREDFTLRSDATGGGLQRALIERFLRDTQRGNAEQFTASFVLLARSLGVDARVAVGFEVSPDAVDRDNTSVTLTLRSDDATVWPEVRFGEEWVAFDPVPPIEASDAAEPPLEENEQSPAAAQPPIDTPTDSGNEPIVTQSEDQSGQGADLPAVVTWVARTGAVAALLLVPLVLFVLTVLGIKWQRRRRGLAGAAVDRVRGAWNLATNRLVDAGMHIDAADTNSEIVDGSVDFIGGRHRELSRLASLANASTFGTPPRADLLADDAAFCLNEVERTMAEQRTKVQRLRWKLSLRSLRRTTRSPV